MPPILRKVETKLRFYMAVFISIMPFSKLRILLYRIIHRYKIAWNAKIGFATIIAVDKVSIGRAVIGGFNRFCGPFELNISDNASVGQKNRFSCGQWAVQGRYRDYGYARSLKIGNKAVITEGHFFDVIGGFELGDNSWIAGRDSQFWTHGTKINSTKAEDRMIIIGNKCYIGSAVRFMPGTKIGNNTIVAMGSVVTKKFSQDYLMVGGVPAKIIRENYDWASRAAISDDSNDKT